MNFNTFLFCLCAVTLTTTTITVDGAGINLLSGSSGCLRPDLSSVESDVTDNDPSTMPESVTKTRNFEKLMMFFQQDCVQTEEEAQYYLMTLKTLYPCISESVTANHPNGIYHASSSNQYFVFLSISGSSADGDSCCIDEGHINYDDYCLAHIDYELQFQTEKILSDLQCIDEPVSFLYWGLDHIDGTYLERIYSHPDTLNNIEDIDVDLYIIDSGVLSTHNEFISTYNGVTHGDATFGDTEIESNHGTHVAGIAGGISAGIAKGFHINEYAVCSRGGSGTGCPFQFILESYDYILQTITTTGRRGVINMSWGGPTSDEVLEMFYDELVQPLVDIANAGGILVASAGNNAADGCGFYPAKLDVVISVGSATHCSVSFFSNYGECVDIYAPGSEIRSSVVYSTTTCELANNNYAILSGTSMASPMIAGVAANMLAFNDELTMEEIVDILQSSNDNIELINCISEEDGFDCIQFAMDCESMKEETQFVPFEFDCDEVQNSNLCENSPCTCDEIDGPLGGNSMMHCEVCNDGTGCSQCESGYVKIDYNHGCVNCQEMFGDNCNHCSDFIGCQQCKDATQQPMHNSECGLYYCE